MKISAKKRILASLIILAITVVGLSILGISRISLQSLTGVMWVIVSTTFLAEICGVLVGLCLSSGFRARREERKARQEKAAAEPAES